MNPEQYKIIIQELINKLLTKKWPNIFEKIEVTFKENEWGSFLLTYLIYIKEDKWKAYEATKGGFEYFFDRETNGYPFYKHLNDVPKFVFPREKVYYITYYVGTKSQLDILPSNPKGGQIYFKD